MMTLDSLLDSINFLQNADQDATKDNPYIDIIGAIQNAGDGYLDYAKFDSTESSGIQMLCCAIKKNPKVDIANMIMTMLICVEYQRVKQSGVQVQFDVDKVIEQVKRLKKRINDNAANKSNHNDYTKELQSNVKNLKKRESIAGAINDSDVMLDSDVMRFMFYSESTLKSALLAMTKKLSLDTNSFDTNM